MAAVPFHSYQFEALCDPRGEDGGLYPQVGRSESDVLFHYRRDNLVFRVRKNVTHAGRDFSGFRGTPSIKTWPEEGESKPLTSLPSVLFPDPFGPLRAVSRPGGIENVNSLKTEVG